MLTLCIADVERDVGMKSLSRKEAITILESMRVDIPVPKAAVTQKKRNVALDMAINALNCSEIPNSSDTISRQAALDIYDDYNVAVENGELEAYGKHRKRLLELPSAQPATNCSEIPNGSDDTISRQAAIDALDEQIEQCNKALGSFDISPKDEYAIKVERASLEAYKEQLENMPTAQPEQKRGKWIYNSPVTMKCDQCGFAIKDWDWHRFKICPNCGADMRGEKDG